jgi:enterochelin esterase-like enzyme
VLFDLVGFTGSGKSHIGWKNFEENVPERAARLVAERKLGPCLIAFPDCFTALGGNQYINSVAVGRYADYLTRELIPVVDREFRTLADRDHRGCFGKSSGGYGALIHGMKYSRYWGAIAIHSGDVYFDFVYRCDWPGTLDELAKYRAKPRREGLPSTRSTTWPHPAPGSTTEEYSASSRRSGASRTPRGPRCIA